MQKVQTLKTDSKFSIWNEKMSVTYRIDSKEIVGRDLTDPFNEPAFYSTSKRNIKNAFTLLEQQVTEETTMHKAMQIIGLAGVNTRSYCMMD